MEYQARKDVANRRAVDRLMTVIVGDRDMALSLGLFNGWVFAMSWSGVFRAPFDGGSSPVALHGLWLASLLVCTLTLLVFLGLPARWRSARRGGIAGAAACLTASTVLAATSHNSPWGVALFFASAVLSGLGTGVFSAYWGKLITRYDSGVVLQLVSVALVGAALITLLVAIAPQPMAYGLMALMPLPLARSFGRALGRGSCGRGALDELGVIAAPAEEADAEGPGRAGAAGAERDRDSMGGRSSLAMFLVLAVVLGVSAGLLRELTGADVAPSQRAVVFGLSTLCAAAMLLLSKVPGEGESFALFYRAIAFIAGAFIILTVVVQQAAYQSALALGLHTMGFMYFYGLLWVFCVIYAHQRRDPMRVFVAGFFANQLGQVAGAWAASGLQLFWGTGSFMATASNAMIYVLLFVVITLMAKLSVAQPRLAGAAKASTPSLAREEGMALACGRAVTRFGLTPREAEILPALVRGYDRGYIAEMLVVSPETVKSHTRHIYEKLDVHTRVELFNAVSACLEDGVAASGGEEEVAGVLGFEPR